jgi:hypothetical protein
MHQRIKDIGRVRLKIKNFVILVKGKNRKHEALTSPKAVSLTAKTPTPPWRRTELPELICDIPGIIDKELQTTAERKCIAVEYINDSFPKTH